MIVALHRGHKRIERESLAWVEKVRADHEFEGPGRRRENNPIGSETKPIGKARRRKNNE
jgi:hypothetical protein